MGYATITLAIMGIAVGAIFRLKVLLAVLAILLLASILVSVGRGLNFLDTALTIMVVQTVVQAGYFVGLVARAVLTSSHGAERVL